MKKQSESGHVRMQQKLMKRNNLQELSLIFNLRVFFKKINDLDRQSMYTIS
jgi:hypothetical protein